jgi:hypothetical protein
LQPATYAELFKPQVLADGYPTQQVVKPHWNTYGLGWFQHDYRGEMLQYHTGSLMGAVAIAALIPEKNFGMYVFENLDHAELRHALMYKSIDLWCFDDNSRDWSKELFSLYNGFAQKARTQKAETYKRRKTGTKPSLALTEFAGQYQNELYGTLTVSIRNDSLFLSFPGNVALRATHWHYDTFIGRSNFPGDVDDDWWIQFFLTRDGKAGELEVLGTRYRKKDD